MKRVLLLCAALLVGQQAFGAWGGATPTFLTNGSGDSGSFGSSVTTDGSVSPTSGALVIVVAGAQRAGGDTSVASIGLGGTLSMSTAFSLANDGTTDCRSQYTGGSLNPMKEIWWGISSGGTGAITVNYNVSNPRQTVQVFEVASGFDSGDPISQCDNATATTTTSPSGTYGTTPGSDNLLFSAIWAEGSGGTLNAAPGSGWTELNELTGSSDHNQVQYASGDNGTTYDWSGLDNSPTEQVMTALEIAASASGSVIPVLHHQLRNQ